MHFQPRQRTWPRARRRQRRPRRAARAALLFLQVEQHGLAVGLPNHAHWADGEGNLLGNQCCQRLLAIQLRQRLVGLLRALLLRVAARAGDAAGGAGQGGGKQAVPLQNASARQGRAVCCPREQQASKCLSMPQVKQQALACPLAAGQSHL